MRETRQRTERTSAAAAGTLGLGLIAAAGLRGRRQRAAARAGAGRSVRDAMTREPATIGLEDTIETAAQRLAELDVGALVACDRHGRLAGVLTDRDVVVRVVAQGEDPATVTVGECLHGEPVVAQPSEPLADVAQRMAAHQVRRVPVVERGRPIGIVAHADVAAHAPGHAGHVLRSVSRARGDERSAAWVFRRAYGRRDGAPVSRPPQPAATDGELTAAVREMLTDHP